MFCDVLELRVAVRMLLSLDGLLRRLKAVAELVQQFADGALLRLICYRARVVASPNLLPAVAGLRMQRWPRESAWMLVGNWCERSVKYAPEAAERLLGSRNESARTVAGDERSVDRRTAY